jgi:hypothetical protein
MTIICGLFEKISPCCGTFYRTRRYASLNFSAFAHWTDGYREGSLMPDGHGLRKCKCGEYFLLNEMSVLARVEESTLPDTDEVTPSELPEAIAKARNKQVEIAARMDYWQYLNHPYREQYRAFRDARDGILSSFWRLLARIFTKRSALFNIQIPSFDPSVEQKENMKGLLRLLSSYENSQRHAVKIAELHRELGEFDAVAVHLSQHQNREDTASRLIRELGVRRVSAPVRYRM